MPPRRVRPVAAATPPTVAAAATKGGILMTVPHAQETEDVTRLRADIAHLAAPPVAGRRVGTDSSFLAAANAILAMPLFTQACATPLSVLAQDDDEMFGKLAGTFNHFALSHSISHALTQIAAIALRPLVSVLSEQLITSVSLIPCGSIAALPLLGAPINAPNEQDMPAHWQTFAEAFPHGASIAPSALALVAKSVPHHQRAGLKGVGNPAKSGKP
jgi:hypothetical protein